MKKEMGCGHKRWGRSISWPSRDRVGMTDMPRGG